MGFLSFSTGFLWFPMNFKYGFKMGFLGSFKPFDG